MSTIKQYFDIRELVCPHVYTKFKDTAWSFFDKRLLDTILWIRESIGKPMYINNWDSGGNFSQRGLRCNLCQLVKDKTLANTVYLSAHCLGLAVDFDIKGMTAQQVRDWLIKHKDLLPYPIRLEDGVSWVHLDLRNTTNDKIKLFKA